MSTKASISGDYLAQQKLLHEHKVWPSSPWSIFMTGDLRPRSIGEAIRLDLEENGQIVRSYQDDIRHWHKFPVFSRSGYWHALIMCHGVMRLDWFEDIQVEKLSEIIDVNVTGTAAMAQRFVQGTLTLPWRKRIIIIGSMAYKSVLNGSAIYCASKAAVAMLTRCLAWELAPKGFDVFCIHPSNVEETPMSGETMAGLMRYRGMTGGQAESYWKDSVLRSTQLTKDHIVDTVNYLLSPKSEFLSGSQIELAGGQR